MEYRRREKDSMETSCDRKRRFSGSHSRHPLSRLRQPPPPNVLLFRSFDPADSSRVPLLVSRATGWLHLCLHHYRSATIWSELDRRLWSISSRLCSPSPLSLPPSLLSPSATFNLSSPTYQFNEIVVLVSFNRCSIRHFSLQFCYTLKTKKFSLFDATRDKKRKRERKKEKGKREREKRERHRSMIT